MKDWRAYYREHLVTTAEAARQIKDGDVVWIGNGPQMPFTLLDEMHQHMEDYHDVFFMWNVATNPIPIFFDPATKGHFKLTSFFNLPLDRMSGEMGVMEYHSCGYDHMDESFFEYGGSVVAIHVCSPDDEGWCNLGHYGVSTGSIVMNDPRVKLRIGFIDRTGQYPIPGEHHVVDVHVTDFDYLVECDTELLEIIAPQPSDVDKLIAAQIMPYIHKNDTLEIGYGGLAEEILANLHDVGPVDIYSEVVCDKMIDLIEEGVITKAKACSPGAVSTRFFKFMSVDPRVQLLPRDKMINLFEIAKQDNLVAINATLMVDLLGQACSEAQGLKPYSGVGGSFAYVYGAMRSKGGRSFMCLRSTYHDEAGERHSNVVAWLPEGSIVTIPKNYQMYIVTEYGLADIYLKTMPDRIRAMIRIAHPDYREGLKEKILTTSLVTERDFEDYELFEQTAAPAAAEA